MKPSPLQLKWVTYPAASYDIVEDYEGSGVVAIPAVVEASIRFSMEGDHLAYLKVSSAPDGVSVPYSFEITVVAAWSFDLVQARSEYKPRHIQSLPPMLAVNVARILYSGAREFLAILTSRGTYGAATLDSLLLEPQDVRITSDESPEVILKNLFKASKDELKKFNISAEQAPAQQTKSRTKKEQLKQ